MSFFVCFVHSFYVYHHLSSCVQFFWLIGLLNIALLYLVSDMSCVSGDYLSVFLCIFYIVCHCFLHCLFL